MAIAPINETITAVPPAGKRGVQVQDDFVIAQEQFQDAVSGNFVGEVNNLITAVNVATSEINTEIGNVNTASDSALNAESYAVSPEDTPVQEFVGAVGTDVVPTAYSALHHNIKVVANKVLIDASEANVTALEYEYNTKNLGAQAVDPVVDLNGNALVAGAYYFDTTLDMSKSYNGTVWVTAYADLSATLLKNNNLSDLGSLGTALTNLGLGNVDNTADLDKPVSTAVDANFASKTSTAQQLFAGGIAIYDDANLNRFRVGRNADQFITIYGDSTGNHLEGKSTYTNPKSLSIDVSTGSTKKTLWLPYDTNNLSYDGNNIWHSGNSNLPTVDWIAKTVTVGSTTNVAILEQNQLTLWSNYDNVATKRSLVINQFDTGSGASIALVDTDGTVLSNLTLLEDGDVTIDSNKVWHAGNDGVGSGLDADLLQGYDLSSLSLVSTVVRRDTSGHIFSNAFNTTVAETTTSPSTVMVETSSDGFIRKQTLADFKGNLGVDRVDNTVTLPLDATGTIYTTLPNAGIYMVEIAGSLGTTERVTIMFSYTTAGECQASYTEMYDADTHLIYRLYSGAGSDGIVVIKQHIYLGVLQPETSGYIHKVVRIGDN